MSFVLKSVGKVQYTEILVVETHVDFQLPTQDEKLRFLPNLASRVSLESRHTSRLLMLLEQPGDPYTHRSHCSWPNNSNRLSPPRQAMFPSPVWLNKARCNLVWRHHRIKLVISSGCIHENNTKSYPLEYVLSTLDKVTNWARQGSIWPMTFGECGGIQFTLWPA